MGAEVTKRVFTENEKSTFRCLKSLQSTESSDASFRVLETHDFSF